jgi:hypothetical protein
MNVNLMALRGVYELLLDGVESARTIFLSAAQHPWYGVGFLDTTLFVDSMEAVLIRSYREALPADDQYLLE